MKHLPITVLFCLLALAGCASGPGTAPPLPTSNDNYNGDLPTGTANDLYHGR